MRKMKNMDTKILKNESGFTLIEMLIAALISIAVLGATIYVFNKQEKVLRTERQETFIRGLGRTVLADLSEKILLAGLGMPSGGGILNASDGDSITFLANTNNIHTMTDTDIAAGATQVSVDDNDEFTAGDWICIMSNRRYTQFLDTALTPDLNWGQCVEITNVGGSDEIDFQAIPGAPANYTAATMSESLSSGDGIMVSQIFMVEYAFDSANNQITLSTNGGAATPVASNVSNLAFAYFDQANAAIDPTVGTNYKQVRKVTITLELEDPVNPEASMAFTTDLNLRNNGV
jgi:type II secretory pathway pseudopilin PulG